MSNQEALQKQARGQLVTADGMGGTALERRAETSAVAVAERAKAEVQARFLVAYQQPRNCDAARRRVLDHCERLRFAQSARYSKPLGGRSIEGPSIRFVEAALQAWGNVDTSSSVVFEDEEQRIVRVIVTDLERNITYHRDITVRKVVERRNASGREIVGSRTNKKGDPVYIVRATDDELLTLQSALESKAVRTLGLRILPADVVDEAMDKCIDVVRAGIDQDPKRARKQIVDAFASLNIPAEKLAAAGFDLDIATPDEILEWRAIYYALRDGECKWSDVVRHATDEDDGKKPTKGMDAIRARAQKERAKQGIIDAESGEAPQSSDQQPEKKASGSKSESSKPKGSGKKSQAQKARTDDPPDVELTCGDCGVPIDSGLKCRACLES